MLTGTRAFEGETVSDTLASVAHEGAGMGALPAEFPRGMRRLLARCLTKDPRMRLRDIGEARVAIDEMGRIPSMKSHPRAITPRSLPAWNVPSPGSSPGRRPRRRGRLAAFTGPCPSARSTIHRSAPARAIAADRTELRPGLFPGWRHDRRLWIAGDRKPNKAAPRQPEIGADPKDGGAPRRCSRAAPGLRSLQTAS